jgi:pSer/pThr/pTyr-binding forkhead associated (FHA) protein
MRMSEARPMGASPIAIHASTAQELKDRLAVTREGQAHVIYRDAVERQVIRILSAMGGSLTIGRRDECDISLPWDNEVSRVHGELQPIGPDWAIVDNGLSRNGSFVNSERLEGRRLLRDGDLLLVGRTTIVYRQASRSLLRTTTPGRHSWSRDSVSDGDRRVLVALCRPLKNPEQALPASNQAIAEELCLSIPAVKKRLTSIFARFDLDHLPQSEKRTRLALMALQSGIVGIHDP